MDVLEILRAGGYSKIKLVALEGVPDAATAVGGRKPQALGGLDRDRRCLTLDIEAKRPSRRLWIFAALGALALHVGGAALAVAHLRTDDPDDSLGAPAIEIGLEMASPHLEATDLPPGPDAEASVASPALAEQKAEIKETELPKDAPTETDDPDRVVTPNKSEQAQGRRSKDRRGANPGLDGIGRGRSNRDAQLRSHSGRAAFGRARAGHRRKRCSACGRPGRRS